MRMYMHSAQVRLIRFFFLSFMIGSRDRDWRYWVEWKEGYPVRRLYGDHHEAMPRVYIW